MNRHFILGVLLCTACNTTTTPPLANSKGVAGDLQVQVVRLEHAQAKDVAKVLEESLVSRSASGGACRVAVQPEQNALVFSGTTAQIREALEVVAQFDSRPGR